MINAESKNEDFYRAGLRAFRRVQKNGYEPQPPRGARGSKNALFLLAHGWVRGAQRSVGFIRAQYWLHKSVSEACDTTGAVYETRLARRTKAWENGDTFEVTGASRP